MSWALRENDAESADRIHWDFDDDRGKVRVFTYACAVKRIFFCMHFEHRDYPQFIEGRHPCCVAQTLSPCAVMTECGGMSLFALVRILKLIEVNAPTYMHTLIQ